MNLGDIDRWDIGALDALEETLTTRIAVLADVENELAAIDSLPGWTGDASAAARNASGLTRADVNREAVGIGAVRALTQQTRVAVAHLQSQLGGLRETATANSMLITEAGSVLDVAFAVPPTDPSARAVREKIRADLHDSAHALIMQAVDIDADAAQVLAKAGDGTLVADGAVDLASSLTTGAGQGELSAPFPPHDATASQVDAYWDALPEEQRAQMISEHPQLIGNLDGIPASARSEANIGQIAGDRERLEQEATALRAKLDDNTFGGYFSDDDAALGHVQNKLADLESIERSLKDNPGALLTVYDMTSHERGLAAIAVGNPDTADHVTVTTPGLGTNIGDSMESMVREAKNMNGEMMNQLELAGRSDETVANIAWIGYQPPELGGVSWWDSISGAGDVASDEIAKEGGASLASYFHGLDAASTNPDPNISAFGHSYGSLTTSEALQHGGSEVVDNAVFYGSPGLDAVGTSEMGMDYEDVWVMDAEGDYVTILGRLGPFSPFEAGPYNNNYQEISTAPGTTPDGTARDGVDDHSGYPRLGSNGELRTSGYNLAVIGIGRPDLVMK